MIVLGIDPGSVTTGWALLESKGNKVSYLSSGILKFDSKVEFIRRLTQIKKMTDDLISQLAPNEIALESLIFVKSPTALIKLSQTRGIILSSIVEDYEGRIYEYAPNLIKSTAVGYGHADKKSVKKFLDMMLGKRDYQTHDESDAVAIALCHIINKNSQRTSAVNSQKKSKSSSKGLAGALAHKIG